MEKIKQERFRGFEVCDGFKDVNLPERKTKHSAGYDFEAVEDVTISPLIYNVASYVVRKMLGKISGNEIKVNLKEFTKPTLISTGVKAFMQSDEALFLYSRSSSPLKKFLLMSNGVGVVDSDYYNNEENEGNIMFQFVNFGLFPVTIKKGERIGQGVFKKYLKVDNDEGGGKRKGGHGSTDS